MSRMDRYTDLEEHDEEKDEHVVLSRVNKNQVIYDDAYLNSKIVDFNTIIGIDESAPIEKNETDSEIKKEEYKPKSYDVNDYLSKAHENKKEDNLRRDINDNEFKEQEDEIRKLIASIDEKEIDDDFFSDLKGENEDTMIGAKFKTDEFNNSIYETLKEENLLAGNTILDHVLSDNTVLNLEKEENDKIDHTFEEILKSDDKEEKKKKRLPIIIFCITLFILIAVIVIIIIIR